MFPCGTFRLYVLVTDTIAAIATPPGRGGVGIIRLSGPLVQDISRHITGRLPQPRRAELSNFSCSDGQVIDQGLSLFFPAPHSFTGEDVLELQGHGGPVVMDMLLHRCLELGTRLARPGEFSERAFLNNKLDLAQAEAIADLIDSETTAAARLATRSLQGVFSERINELVAEMIQLRIYVEAAIDFPEEEIDFLSDGKVSTHLQIILKKINEVKSSARTGRLLRDGMTLVIAGRPNAGKSSLLNALSGVESAIVTDIPGTTRDVLRERIQLDGMPLHLIDTAGLRDSSNRIEQEGIRRAQSEIEKADVLLWIYDAAADSDHTWFTERGLPAHVPVIFVRNKIDLVAGAEPEVEQVEYGIRVSLSIKYSIGMDLLTQQLKSTMNYEGSENAEFIARRRHLYAIDRALSFLVMGQHALDADQAGELLADDLRQAQSALSEITGDFTADDLLGEIFASFCIGK